MTDGERVLFLDVDGVLNYRACFVPGGGHLKLCPQAVRRLRAVVEDTGCRVVLSSTWRTMPAFIAALWNADAFPSPHHDWRTIEKPWQTQNGLIIASATRGHEIAEWLSRHPEVTTYAIVDDDSDMLPEQKPFFVQTSFDTGLTDEHAERLVAILTATTQP